MGNAWSLVWYEGQWHEDMCQQPIVSDNKFAVDMEDQEGCSLTLSTNSQDGVIYRGGYQYNQEGYPPGSAAFERYKSRRGDVFIGEWSDNTDKGKWIIQTWK